MGTIVVVPKVAPTEVDTTETHDGLLSDISDEAVVYSSTAPKTAHCNAGREREKQEWRGGEKLKRPDHTNVSQWLGSAVIVSLL